MQEKADAAAKEAETAKAAWLCRVCLSAEVDMSIVPCGHVLCRRCSSAVSTCPFCRFQVKRFMRIYRPWELMLWKGSRLFVSSCLRYQIHFYMSEIFTLVRKNKGIFLVLSRSDEIVCGKKWKKEKLIGVFSSIISSPRPLAHAEFVANVQRQTVNWFLYSYIYPDILLFYFLFIVSASVTW